MAHSLLKEVEKNEATKKYSAGKIRANGQSLSVA